MYNLCLVLQAVITVVLTVMSGLGPHMVSLWFGWITAVELWFWELVIVSGCCNPRIRTGWCLCLERDGKLYTE
jgi:hypothetical protein